LSPSSARHVALAEAVERVGAQTLKCSNFAIASRRELVAAGLFVPKFVASGRDLFSDDLTLDWYPAFSLDGKRGALPAELVHYPRASRIPVRSFSVHHTSGLAAGATVAEAATAALLELIETDCLLDFDESTKNMR